MKARTKDYPAGPVQAFGGFEYVAYEWRDVPLGCEDQAEQHPFLEIEQTEPAPEVSAMVEPVKPKPTPRKRAPRKRAVKKATPKGDE